MIGFGWVDVYLCSAAAACAMIFASTGWLRAARWALMRDFCGRSRAAPQPLVLREAVARFPRKAIFLEFLAGFMREAKKKKEF